MIGTPTYEDLEQRVQELENEVAKCKKINGRLHFLSTAIEQSREGVAMCNMEGILLFVNNAFAAMHGYSPEELVGKHLSIFHSPEQMPSVEAANRQIQDRGKFCGEIWHVRHNGSVFLGQMTNSLIRDEGGNPIGMVAVMRDITKENLSKEALIESENRFDAFFNEAPAGLVILDDQFRYLKINKTAARMNGLPVDEHMGKTIYEVLGEFAPKIIPTLQHILETGETLNYEVSGEIPRSDGIRHWIASTFPVSLVNKNAIGNIFVEITPQKLAEGALQKAHDELEQRVKERTAELSKANAQLKREIEERKQAEEALEKSENRYRNLVENINDVIFSTDHDGIITYISPVMESIIGYNPSEIIGHHFTNFIVQEDRESLKKRFQKIISGELAPCEYRVVTKSGKIKWVKFSGRANLEGNAVIGISGVLSDITLTKLLEDQLIRSERLAATGQLAASIAHEINSPLQGIVALLDLIQKSCIRDEELLTNIDLLKGAACSIRDTVKKLLDLNRPSKERKQSVNVNKILEDTVALLRTHLKRNKVNVNLDLSSEVPHIKASHQQMGLIFMNLINNAVEAISGISQKNARQQQAVVGGEITITTSLKEDIIIINVADTGPGISDEALQHIFDPFYTHKKTMGMGVGLSICHGIIEDHRGNIAAKNSPESGAVFTITLPVNR